MSVRPVYGYRCWDLSRDDRGFVLQSLSGLSWTSPVMGPARNRAGDVAPLTTTTGDAWRAGDQAPGFYAVKDLADPDTQAHRYLAGIVRLWGTVAEHERGWRGGSTPRWWASAPRSDACSGRARTP